MIKPTNSKRKRPATVTTLTLLPDLSGESAIPEKFPIYRDPIIQLLGLGVVFVLALVASLVISGVLVTVLQATVLATVLISSAVLLRSVRHGWNVKAYGRARRALQREATLRLECDAYRKAFLGLGSALVDKDEAGGWPTLQPTVLRMQQVLARTEGRNSLAVVEERGGSFMVLAVAGYLCDRPSYVAPGKSCVADRPFSELLRSYASAGSTAARMVDMNGRRYWVGAVWGARDSGALEDVVGVLAAWVLIVAAVTPQPELADPILRAG